MPAYFSFLCTPRLTSPPTAMYIVRMTTGAVLRRQNRHFGLSGRMTEDIRYTIFDTRWGCFGLLAGPDGITGASLPVATPSKARRILLAGARQARYDGRLFAELQDGIRAYFQGAVVDFADVPVDPGAMSPFACKVLRACRRVRFGQRASYFQLARLAQAPKAVRAVASVMAKNPVPLIIPCHRIIRSDGSIGGFSAPGGTGLKKRLLDLESQSCA